MKDVFEIMRFIDTLRSSGLSWRDVAVELEKPYGDQPASVIAEQERRRRANGVLSEADRDALAARSAELAKLYGVL